MTHFVWGGSVMPPSERQSKKILIKTVPKGVSIVHFLGSLCETVIHWNPAAGRRGRSSGHRLTDCPHCKDGIPLRVNGYAPVLWWEDFWQTNGVEQPVHVQRWAVAVISCPETLTGDLQELSSVAGRTFRFERENTSSPVIRFTPFDTGKLVVAVPSVEPFDVHTIVEKAWGFRRVGTSPAQPAPRATETPDPTEAMSPDERRADEHAQIRRLKAENRKLKEQLRAREGQAAPPQPAAPQPAEPQAAPPPSIPVRTAEQIKASLAEKFGLNGGGKAQAEKGGAA